MRLSVASKSLFVRRPFFRPRPREHSGVPRPSHRPRHCPFPPMHPRPPPSAASSGPKRTGSKQVRIAPAAQHASGIQPIAARARERERSESGTAVPGCIHEGCLPTRDSMLTRCCSFCRRSLAATRHASPCCVLCAGVLRYSLRWPVRPPAPSRLCIHQLDTACCGCYGGSELCVAFECATGGATLRPRRCCILACCCATLRRCILTFCSACQIWRVLLVCIERARQLLPLLRGDGTAARSDDTGRTSAGALPFLAHRCRPAQAASASAGGV